MEHGMDFTLVNAFYNISPQGISAPVLTMPARELLQEEPMRAALRKGGELSQAIGMKLPASYAGLTLFNLVATKLLFAAQYNRLLDLSLDNLTYQVGSQGGYAVFGYRIDDVRWRELPVAGAEREALLLPELEAFFRATVNPAIRSIADAAGVKPQMIWNQFGARNAYMLDYMAENEQRADVLERFRSDNRVLAELLPPSLFGLRRNPFRHTPRYVDSPYKPGARIMIRSSCCMYDCRVNGEPCYNCPRLTEEQRTAMFEEIAAKAATP